jgi:uncharacterized membrane protein YfcA
VDISIFIYILVGFAAQIVDGALGMAYGVTCNSFLLGVGVPAPLASASVHAAEVVTSFASGLAHFRLGNVHKRTFLRLLVPGVIGGVLGAYVLTNLPGDVLKPYIAFYLILMGARIIQRALRKDQPETQETDSQPLVLLGFFGGLLDAIGGGGWGPIVTSTLVARGSSARKTIGTVNAAEFFVTLAQTITFSVFLTLTNWQVVIGLMIGGLLAAPLAAVVTKRLDPKKLMLAVGVFIIALSMRTIYLSFR